MRDKTSRDSDGSFIAVSSLLKGTAMQTASLLLAIQNDCYFALKNRAESVEPAFDADRSDWKIVDRGIVNPFDITIPGCNVSGRECSFRLHPSGDQRGQ